jgi:hypothetical protein
LRRKIVRKINTDLTISTHFANHGLTVGWSIKVHEKRRQQQAELRSLACVSLAAKRSLLKNWNTMRGEKRMNLKTTLGVLGVTASLCLCGGSLLAQDDNGGGPGNPGGGPPGGPGDRGPGGDFDPAQFRQRMMDRVRKNLSVTNDAEWTVIQPMVQKVMDARREADMGGGMGMRGPGGPGGPGGGRGFGPPASEEQKALQKALDSNAPAAQIKDALAKYRAARKAKQANLEAAQADLKSVLDVGQEAQAVLMGLLP